MTPQQRASFLELVDKYLAGTATAEERAVVERYDALFADAPDALDSLNTEQLGRLEHQLKLKIKARIRKGERPAVPLYRRWKGIGPVPAIWKVAAAVAAITLGTWLYYSSPMNGSRTEFGTGSSLVNDIAPGKQGATITLADGKVIQLSDAKTGVIVGEDLKYTDGTPISSSLREGTHETSSGQAKQSHHAILTANTAKGQTYQFTLPDGSRVWLNADSKISFPSQFIGAQRKIILSGEAYFEVSHNKLKPFIVQTNKQEVTVLGTHFNINSYADEGVVKTTLLEGSVRVLSSRGTHETSSGGPSEVGMTKGVGMTSSLSSRAMAKDLGPTGLGTTKAGGPSEVGMTGGGGTILKPGQQSVVSGSNRIIVKDVQIEDVIDWKNGYFMFNNERLESIMERLARWYNLQVVYEDESLKNETFYGKVGRYENISRALRLMESTDVIQFNLHKNKLKILRKIK